MQTQLVILQERYENLLDNALIAAYEINKLCSNQLRVPIMPSIPAQAAIQYMHTELLKLHFWEKFGSLSMNEADMNTNAEHYVKMDETLTLFYKKEFDYDPEKNIEILNQNHG